MTPPPLPITLQQISEQQKWWKPKVRSKGRLVNVQKPLNPADCPTRHSFRPSCSTHQVPPHQNRVFALVTCLRRERLLAGFSDFGPLELPSASQALAIPFSTAAAATATPPCTVSWQPSQKGRRLQPNSNGLQPTSDGLQPNSDGLQPNSEGLQPKIWT